MLINLSAGLNSLTLMEFILFFKFNCLIANHNNLMIKYEKITTGIYNG
jgi:hypothetical protein